MRLIVCFVVLWIVIVSFVLDSCDYVSAAGKEVREAASSGIIVSGKWYQLSH